MNREERRQFDVLVIGGGPAGMAAAACAAESGVRVGMVDDNFKIGGQIWRGESGDSKDTVASHWARRLRRSGAMALCGLRVVHQPEPGVLSAENLDGFCELRYEKLVLATGARERFLPFPGWTLPNVMGAGGLQAMVKSGLPIQGKRVVVAGTGPLLLAVADYLRKRGADLLLIAEQASSVQLARFAVGLFSKRSQAFSLKRQLKNVPYRSGCWVA